MPRSHRRPLPNTDASPPWLVQLRSDLFAHLPADEPVWLHDGESYHCRRTLRDERGHLRFLEVWHDPVTDMVRQQWGLDVEAGAFVGLHDPHAWGMGIAFLLRGIEGSRPQNRPAVAAPPVLNAGRFQRTA
jgi:hypothetical protein